MCLEPYLSIMRNCKHRESLTKFRLSDHKLHIETEVIIKNSKYPREIEIVHYVSWE